MGTGAVVQKSMVGSSSLTQLIEEKLKEKRVKLPLLHGGALRASEFGDLCPREEVLASEHQVVREEELAASTIMLFLHGSALHWAMQNHLLPDIGVMVGRWTCLDCGANYGDGSDIPNSLVPRPQICACSGKEFLYRELQLYNETYKIGGHPDGFLVIPGLPGVGVIEGKSIGRGFEVKQCPAMNHVIQAQIYMWFTGLLWSKILYWEKSASGTEALIEHHVDRDDDTIASIKEAIKEIWASLETGSLPARVCASAEAPRAKKCPLFEPCFNTKVVNEF